jgi:hypothetical protein
MRESLTAAGWAIIVAVLVLAPLAAAAQSLSNPFDRNDAPALVQNFGGGPAHNLNREFELDLYALYGFGGKQRVDRFARATLERPMPWKFYGRIGPLNFQNQLEPQPQGFRFSFQRTGPSLTGRVYFGITRTFD